MKNPPHRAVLNDDPSLASLDWRPMNDGRRTSTHATDGGGRGHHGMSPAILMAVTIHRAVRSLLVPAGGDPDSGSEVGH